MALEDAIGGSVWLFVAVLLFVVAAWLAFGPGATNARRLLATYLALLGFQDLSALASLLGAAPSVQTATFYWRVDITYLGIAVLAVFLWIYPAPAKLRSANGLVMGAATAYLAVAVLLWWSTREALNVDHQPGGWGSRRTMLGHFFLFHNEGVTLALASMIVCAFFRALPLATDARRSALLVLPALVPWAIYWAGGTQLAVLLGALGVPGYELSYPPFTPVPGDAYPATFGLFFAQIVVMPWAIVALWWRRANSLVPLILLGGGLLHTLFFARADIDFWALQHVFAAVLPAYAFSHELSTNGRTGRAAIGYAIATIAGVTAFLSVNAVTVYLARGAAFFLPVGVLAGLALGAVVAVALVPAHHASAWGLPFARADAHAETRRRFAAYRAALAQAMDEADGETTTKLRTLRMTLGISEREHAAMEYSLRDDAATPSARGRPIERAAKEGELLFGRYRVGAILGHGGAGTTRLARDEIVARDVVLKTIRASGTEGVDAILREARAIGSLNDAHVATLYDVEQVGDEALLVMEHVEGGSLKDRLAKGPLDHAEFLRVADGILRALEAVHGARMTHRDVKPSNVLLTKTGAAKLADFGIAHIPGFETTIASGASEAAVGTVRYMSPEQAKGRRATAASDLYGAGVTLYEAWAGRAYLEPREGETAVEVQMRAAAATGFDAPLEGPAFLRTWFERALAADPARRFASAREMREALLGALSSA